MSNPKSESAEKRFPRSCGTSLCVLLTSVQVGASAACPSGDAGEFVDWLAQSGYNARRFPVVAHPPIRVAVWPHIVKVNEFSPAKQNFKLNMYMRMMWTDPGLAWGNVSTGCEGNVIVRGDAPIWYPDIVIDTASDIKTPDLREKYTRVDSTGTVFYSKRTVATIFCGMDFMKYPFDVQTCVSGFESYAHNASNIRVIAGDDVEGRLLEQDEVGAYEITTASLTHPDLVLESYYPGTGTFSRIEITMSFERQRTKVILTMFLPLWLVVFISMLGMYIDNEKPGPRVAMGIVPVLVLITLLFTFSKEIPVVAYRTVLEEYIAMCLAYVVLNCCMYALVNYVTTEVRRRNAAIDIRKGVRQQFMTEFEQLAAGVVSPTGRTVRGRRVIPDRIMIHSGLFPFSSGLTGAVARKRLRKQEIREAFDIFSGPKGRLDAKDLGPLLLHIISKRHQRSHRVGQSEMAQWLSDFETYDVDGDSFLQFREFRNYLEKHLPWMQNEESRAWLFLGCFAMTSARCCKLERNYRRWMPIMFVMVTLWELSKSSNTAHEHTIWNASILAYFLVHGLWNLSRCPAQDCPSIFLDCYHYLRCCPRDKTVPPPAGGGPGNPRRDDPPPSRAGTMPDAALSTAPQPALRISQPPEGYPVRRTWSPPGLSGPRPDSPNSGLGRPEISFQTSGLPPAARKHSATPPQQHRALASSHVDLLFGAPGLDIRQAESVGLPSPHGAERRQSSTLAQHPNGHTTAAGQQQVPSTPHSA